MIGKLKIVITSLFFIIIASYSLFGQSDNSRNYEPEMTNRERILLGVYASSPYIANNGFSSQFNMGLQPFVGWRFNKFIASGLALKFDYTYLWSSTGNQSFTDFSSTLFTRGTLAETFIIQIEGGLYSNQGLVTSTQKIRNNFPVVYAGLGYSFGRTEVLLQAEITGNLARYRLPFEYKFGFIFPL